MLAYSLAFLITIVARCRVFSIVLKCNTTEVINVVEPLDIEYPGNGKLYGNNESCMWRFKGYGPLVLEFTEMDLENDGKEECIDYVFAAGLMDCRGFFKQFETPDDMELEFKSNNKGRRTGFRAVIDNKCPRFSENCDFNLGKEEHSESLLVYTVSNTSRNDSMLMGKDNLEGSFIEGRVKLEMLLFGDIVGATGCYECSVRKPQSEIPSCHSDSSRTCEWNLKKGVHVISGKKELRGSAFILPEGEAEFSTKDNNLRLRGPVCIYFDFLSGETPPVMFLWAERKEDGERILLGTIELNSKGEWQTAKIMQTLPQTLVDIELGLVVTVRLPEEESMLVNKIYGCDPETEEDRYTLIDDEDFTGKVYSFGGGRLSRVGPCINGGQWDGDRCVCRAGYNGTTCEFPCPPNRYGPRCEAQCAGSCASTIFCKRGLGCNCGPGYKGRFCSLNCDSHEFGIDCVEQCLGCSDDSGCDSITGDCFGPCVSGYVPPRCNLKYPHVTTFPKVTPLYSLAIFQVDLSNDTVEGRLQLVSHYKFQFKSEPAEMWNDTEPRRIPDNTSIYYELYNLSAGIDYKTRFILLTDSGEGYEGPDVPTASFSTLCSGYNPLDVTATNVTDSSIYLEWEDRYKRRLACLTEETLVQIKESGLWTDHLVDEYRLNITRLLPGTSYDIRLKPAYATEREYTRLTVSTLPTYFGKVANLKVVRVASTEVNIEWEAEDGTDDMYIQFSITYRCLLVLADPNVNCSTDSGSTLTTRTKLKIRDLSPYRTYEVMVRQIPGRDYSRVVATTDADVPRVAPRLVTVEDRPDGVYVEWAPPNDCSLCNGVLAGYYYQSSVTSLRYTYSIDQSKILLTNLQPGLQYTLKVYLKNTKGRNNMYPLTVEFSTNYRPGEIGQLKVYKRSGESLWLKWRGMESQDFKIYVDGKEAYVNGRRSRCLSWPELYCYIVPGLFPNRTYTLELVGIYEKPHGELILRLKGPKAWVTGVTEESEPDPPVELKAVNTSTTATTLTWAPPEKANGVLRTFLVQVEQLEGAGESHPEFHVPVAEEKPTYSVRVLGLKPASTYRMSVMGYTALRGSPATITFSTRPPQPLAVPLPTLMNSSIEWLEAPAAVGYNPYTKTPYLLLLLGAYNGTVDQPDLNRVLLERLSSGFRPVAEYEEDETLEPERQAGRGRWATVSWPVFSPANNYTFAAVAVSQYKESFNVAIRQSRQFTP